MAKIRETGGREQKGKLSFVMFQLEGSDETLQEGFKAMEQAFEKLSPQRTVLSTMTRKAALLEAKAEDEASDQIENVAEDLDEGVSGAQDTAMSTSPRAKKYPKPEIIEIDMDKALSFKDFFAQRGSPEPDYKRYLAIAVWFKDHRQITEISIDHIYTCYRHMGWTVPKDVAQPLRDLKSKRSCFGKGASVGMYSVNHIGENEVTKFASAQV